MNLHLVELLWKSVDKITDWTIVKIPGSNLLAAAVAALGQGTLSSLPSPCGKDFFTPPPKKKKKEKKKKIIRVKSKHAFSNLFTNTQRKKNIYKQQKWYI